jgi:hypothetical protein
MKVQSVTADWHLGYWAIEKASLHTAAVSAGKLTDLFSLI